MLSLPPLVLVAPAVCPPLSSAPVALPAGTLPPGTLPPVRIGWTATRWIVASIVAVLLLGCAAVAMPILLVAMGIASAVSHVPGATGGGSAITGDLWAGYEPLVADVDHAGARDVIGFAWVARLDGGADVFLAAFDGDDGARLWRSELKTAAASVEPTIAPSSSA